LDRIVNLSQPTFVPTTAPSLPQAATEALNAQIGAVNEAQQAYFANLLTAQDNKWAQALAMQQESLNLLRTQIANQEQALAAQREETRQHMAALQEGLAIQQRALDNQHTQMVQTQQILASIMSRATLI
jgi:hypothetical protein